MSTRPRQRTGERDARRGGREVWIEGRRAHNDRALTLSARTRALAHSSACHHPGMREFAAPQPAHEHEALRVFRVDVVLAGGSLGFSLNLVERAGATN